MQGRGSWPWGWCAAVPTTAPRPLPIGLRRAPNLERPPSLPLPSSARWMFSSTSDTLARRGCASWARRARARRRAARAAPRMSSPYVGRSPSTTRSDGRWRSAIRTGGIVRGCSIRPSGESGMRAERSCVCVCPNLFSIYESISYLVSCSRKAVHTLAFCRDRGGGAVLIMLMVPALGRLSGLFIHNHPLSVMHREDVLVSVSPISRPLD